MPVIRAALLTPGRNVPIPPSRQAGLEGLAPEQRGAQETEIPRLSRDRPRHTTAAEGACGVPPPGLAPAPSAPAPLPTFFSAQAGMVLAGSAWEGASCGHPVHGRGLHAWSLTQQRTGAGRRCPPRTEMVSLSKDFVLSSAWVEERPQGQLSDSPRPQTTGLKASHVAVES